MQRNLVVHPGGQSPGHADNEQPRGDMLGSGEDGGGGRALRGGAGEEAAHPRGRASFHADDHEQPRGDILGSGEDGGGGCAPRGGAGEEQACLGDEHPDTLMTMSSLAGTYWTQGRTEEASALYKEVLEKSRRFTGNANGIHIGRVFSLSHCPI